VTTRKQKAKERRRKDSSRKPKTGEEGEKGKIVL